MLPFSGRNVAPLSCESGKGPIRCWSCLACMIAILSYGPSAWAQINVQDLLTKKRMTIKTQLPQYSWKSNPYDLTVKDVTLTNPKIDIFKQSWGGNLSGAIEPVKFRYTSDIVFPLSGQNRLIMYPIGWLVEIEQATLTGTVNGSKAGVSGEIRVDVKGKVTIEPPTLFLRQATYEARERERKDAIAKKRRELGLGNVEDGGLVFLVQVDVFPNTLMVGEIPVSRDDNDPEDGPLGWEYKTWDKPLDGVRQPRRDDLKGCPEFIRGNGGPLNFYVFLRPKSHAFEASAVIELGNGKANPKSFNVQLLNGAGAPKQMVACPDDFKKARKEGFDWDYAIDASGPLAGLVQDIIMDNLKLDQKINTFVGKPYEIQFAN